jgi:hypothetical protein
MEVMSRSVACCCQEMRVDEEVPLQSNSTFWYDHSNDLPRSVWVLFSACCAKWDMEVPIEMLTEAPYP